MRRTTPPLSPPVGLPTLLVCVVLLASCSSGDRAASKPPATGSSSATASGATPSATAVPAPVVDPLEPASELTVGTHRAVSVCQLIGPDDITSLVGPITGTDKVLETFLSGSFAKTGDARSVATSCDYDITGGVQLRATQWLQGSSALQDVDLVADVLADDSAVVARTTAFEQAVADPSTGADAQTQAFVAELEVGLAAAQDAAAAVRKNTFPDPAYDGKVLPRDGSLTFRFFVGNATYDLTIGSPLDDAPLSKLSTTELVGVLGVAARLVALVRERSVDPTLSQAPVRTVLGASDLVGESAIVEPCLVLSGPVVEGLTGLALEPTTERMTYPANAVERPSASTGDPTLPSSYCTRSATGLRRGEEVGTRDFRLELQIADTPQRLRQLLRRGGYLRRTPGLDRIDTDADYTRADRPVTTDGSTTQAYTFTVGPYFATLTIEDVVSPPGLFTTDGALQDVHRYAASRADTVAAIDALVASLDGQVAALDVG